jgi:hypothetical protein
MSTLKEKKLSSNIIFQGRLLDVRKDEVEILVLLVAFQSFLMARSLLFANTAILFNQK